MVEEGQRQGALKIAVTNDPTSPLDSAAEHCIQLHAGQERSIAATKTYTTSLMAMAMLSVALSEKPDQIQALQEIPNLAAEVVFSAAEIVRATERYRYMTSCVVIGRGYNYATAFEIALKLKELTYVLADPYSSADFQHGPLAVIEHGFPVIAIVPEGRVTQEILDLLRHLRERDAELVVISALEDALDLGQTQLRLPPGIPEWLSPLIAVMPGQIFALGLTLAKGFDPDHPRGLHKVTLTH